MHEGLQERLIVALDVSSAAAARQLVAAVGDSAHTFKIGKQLFTAEGPALVRELAGAGRSVFLDLKFHDIPNTVAAAVKEAGRLGVRMLTVHALGGSAMLRAAAQAAREFPQLQVLAVTVLTSLGDGDLAEIGIGGGVADEVVRLARLAIAAGCHGVVASAQEARALRALLGDKFLIVTPGVRPAGSDAGDQVRVVTPAVAMAAGATHLVVGRPITEAKDPAAAARAIVAEMG